MYPSAHTGEGADQARADADEKDGEVGGDGHPNSAFEGASRPKG